jgi:hypothetical protein
MEIPLCGHCPGGQAVCDLRLQSEEPPEFIPGIDPLTAVLRDQEILLSFGGGWELAIGSDQREGIFPLTGLRARIVEGHALLSDEGWRLEPE